MGSSTSHLQQPVLGSVHRDMATLRQDLTVQQALEALRGRELGGKIAYFYVVDELDRLVGVLPTRQLLSGPADRRLSEVMVSRVVTLPQDATVSDACELFVMHRFLAFPVVDADRRILGVVDVTLLTDEVFDVAERERVNEVFETIGFRTSQVRNASPLRAFRYRFPWLLVTIGGGTVCALMAGAFEATLAQCLLLAFFLTLVLGLGESVSMQSMALTIQALRMTRPTLRWYLRAFAREAGSAVLIGTACGGLVGLIAWAWRGTGLAAVSIGASIAATICAACLLGLSVPALLHALKLDPKVAAGPLTLALADLCTLLLYFGLAALLL